MKPEIPDNVILTNLDDVVNWGQNNPLWPAFFGVSCCFAEIMTRVAPQFDLERLAREAGPGSPVEANLLIITGTPFKRLAPAILQLYEQMPEPKWVIAVGDCAISGGMYDVYSVIQGVNQIVPVDACIPGCPPRPDAFFECLQSFQQLSTNKEQPCRPRTDLQDTPTANSPGGNSEHPNPDGTAIDEILPLQPKSTFPNGAKLTAEQVHERFAGRVRVDPDSVDMPGFIATTTDLPELLKYLKRGTRIKYARLEDITAVDERLRRIHPGHDFTLVYHLLSLQVPGYLRIKVPLTGPEPEAPSSTSLWPSANWYEREVYDMFGIRFSGHPNLSRILMPPDWEGFPLRKDHVSRARDMAPFNAETARSIGPVLSGTTFDGKTIEVATGSMILNIGPYHPATHGVLRLTTQLQEGKIVDFASEIGSQHRGAEKIAERLHWNRFIPYTDRIDYLSGLQNNLAYLHSVETLLGVELPPRAESIRILLCELFRIANHLIWLGTFAHDVGVEGALALACNSREKIFDIVERITGGRMHPAWFCIGGVTNDLPDGWKQTIEKFTCGFDQQLETFEKMLADGPIFRSRIEGLGAISPQSAVDWGLSGPNLRATGIPWDVRRSLSYSGYDRFDFDVVIAEGGDCYARYLVRIGEMRESLKIVRQAVATMPGGQWLIDGSDVDTSRTDNANPGPMAPKGECYRAIESSKGECGYYSVSDGGRTPYRLRIRTPSFPHLQALPGMSRGTLLADLILLLGSVDFVQADLDR